MQNSFPHRDFLVIFFLRLGEVEAACGLCPGGFCLWVVVGGAPQPAACRNTHRGRAAPQAPSSSTPPPPPSSTIDSCPRSPTNTRQLQAWGRGGQGSACSQPPCLCSRLCSDWVPGQGRMVVTKGEGMGGRDKPPNHPWLYPHPVGKTPRDRRPWCWDATLWAAAREAGVTTSSSLARCWSSSSSSTPSSSLSPSYHPSSPGRPRSPTPGDGSSLPPLPASHSISGWSSLPSTVSTALVSWHTPDPATPPPPPPPLPLGAPYSPLSSNFNLLCCLGWSSSMPRCVYFLFVFCIWICICDKLVGGLC